ncbi:MAG TPA: hypothetical protein VFG50_01975 [Rhodothermales bacterium]|nr:hypothetical protein [Rhodothermales bacterium]
MKKLISLLLAAACTVGSSHAQNGGSLIAGQRQPAVVSLLPQYESYTFEGQRLNEASTSVTAFIPVKRNLAVAVRAGHAAAGAADGRSLSGLTDLYLSGTYERGLGTGSAVLGLSGTLPSGRRQLDRADFDALRLFSLEYYGFRVPGFGQGLSVAPSLTLAYPLGETLVLGIGASYIYRGPFEPLADMTGPYDPGDEVLLTGGMDASLGGAASVSLDLTQVLYGADVLDGETWYQAGASTIVTVQLRRPFGRNELWLLGRYRSRGDNLYRSSGALIGETETTTPNLFNLRGQYRFALARTVGLTVLGEGYFLQHTRDFPSQFFEAGIAPSLAISRSVSIPARFVYRFGDVNGFVIGVGIIATM